MRHLPERRNPLLAPTSPNFYEELLSLRRLGKTHLSVPTNQVGTSSATKPQNLGPFEYAHLRAPLPKDLTGSEIFPSYAAKQHPETYFLMRRCKDGYVSATGMFKIAFPWAKYEEEKAEREYLKSREETSDDETAGNVWISPSFALELAKEYKMVDWVRALLDPREIAQSPSTAKKNITITPPPRFELPPREEDEDEPKNESNTLQPPADLASSGRTRSRRSASPAKTSSPRKIASPRKSRRAAKEASAAAATAASETLQSNLESAASTAAAAAQTNGEPAEESETTKKRATATTEDGKATVTVESTTSVRKGVETTKTNVSVDMPVSLPEAPSAEDTKEMIAQARRMVEQASERREKEEAGSPSQKKRKSDDLEEEEDEEAADQPAKRAKLLEAKLRRERTRNRALFGMTAILALGAAIPYYFT